MGEVDALPAGLPVVDVHSSTNKYIQRGDKLCRPQTSDLVKTRPSISRLSRPIERIQYLWANEEMQCICAGKTLLWLP